jgi:hypothetical protein
MTYLILTPANLKLLKDQIRGAYKIRSSHLSEAIAAALGFGSYAALNAHMKGITGQAPAVTLSDDLFVERLQSLGSPIPEWRGFDRYQSAAVKSDAAPDVEFENSGPFRMVYNLWLAPSFERVLAGKAQPPFVDHNAVDFEYLRAVLADEFRFGSPLQIRLANDTIDQVTVHMRQARQNPRRIKCQDFAGLLLTEASKQTLGIIDIRRQWALLHHLTDRRNAPPPVLVPIVVEASDAEDGIMWSHQARMGLGVKAAHPDVAMDLARQKKNDDHQGHLTVRLHKALAKCFNTPYLPFCLLDWAASDPLPKDYRGLEPQR